MDLAPAMVVLKNEISRSSLRSVAKRIGLSHSTVNGWLSGKTPEGERLRSLLEWAEGIAATPKPKLPDILADVERRTGENLVRLSKISGQAETVLRLMQAVTSEQARVVESLRPWVAHEEDEETAALRAKLTAADKTRPTQTAAKPTRRKSSGQ